MVPGLAFDSLEAGDLTVFAGVGIDQRNFAGFGNNQQQILIGQEQHLASAVAARSPGLFAVFEPYAGEKAGAEAVKVAVVHHQIVEIGADRTRGPNLLDLPAVVLVADPHPARAVAERRPKQDIGITQDGRLHHALHSHVPFMVPKNLAVRWIEAGQPLVGGYHDLLDALKPCELERAVSVCARPGLPDGRAGSSIVAEDAFAVRTAREDSDHSLIDKRRRG